MHAEEADLRDGVLGDDLVVFFDFGFLGRVLVGFLFAFLGGIRFGGVGRFVLGEVGDG